MMYLKGNADDAKLVRTEVIFTPLLILLPVFVSILFFYDWFHRGFSMGSSAYDGELILAVIILVGNILFDIPFVSSLIKGLKEV